MILFDIIVENQKWHYDTVLMKRILYRAKSSGDAGRADDNFETAMK